MKQRGKLFKGIKMIAAAFLISAAVFSICVRVPEVFSDSDTALAAAAFGTAQQFLGLGGVLRSQSLQASGHAYAPFLPSWDSAIS